MNQHIQTKKMTPSKEDYLKVMLELSNDEGIHSSSIADALGISRASVSCMMNILKEDGYVLKEKYGTVSLTDRGRNVAANVKKRYELLKKFFIYIVGVSAETAAEDACRIEHLVSFETIYKIALKLEKYSKT